ncbi:MAG: amidohydrolase, partial [Gammaproteobacteria bacterium]|nr:amidohydrolase [Gammaproteobacteria bacterium]
MKLWQFSLLALAVSSTFTLQAADDKSETKKAEWNVNKPQGEFKTIDIKTQTGTWMNLDISPDGKTVVFDLLGDLYTMPISGGTPKQLTNDIGWQMQPKFSPDGKFIAYTSDEGGGDNIWVMKADGSDAKAVTNETFRLLNSPDWSPDGEFIVARKHFTNTRSLGAGEIWQYHKTGGTGVMLTEKANDQKDLGEPAFSPDGKYVYFSQDNTPGNTFHYSKDSEQGIYVIKRFERETGNIEVLLDGPGGAVRPTPSPDGKKLAYIRRVDFKTTLFLYDLASGEQTELYSELDRDMQETWAIHGVYPTLSFTPDNKSIVFWADGKIKSFELASKSVKDLPFSIDTKKQIQTAVRVKQELNQDQIDVKMLRFVQASPDGKTIVYSALGHLYQVDAKGGTPKRLTKQNEEFELYPQFSRDGKKLVFVSWHDQQQGKIKVLDVRSGKVTDVVKAPGKYLEPTFSPDGNTIVFRKGGAGNLLDKKWSLNTGLYAVKVAGGEPILISRNGYAPHFSDRNDRVFAQDFGASP